MGYCIVLHCIYGILCYLIVSNSIAQYCTLLRCWLRRAGCVSQDAFILHYLCVLCLPILTAPSYWPLPLALTVGRTAHGQLQKKYKSIKNTKTQSTKIQKNTKNTKMLVLIGPYRWQSLLTGLPMASYKKNTKV